MGRLLGVVAWLWLRTLRVRLEVDPALASDAAWVLCFFHGKQWPLLSWRRRRRTSVMVSLSADGELQTGVLSMLGFDVVRGSSSRGGARGLAGVVRRLKRGGDAAFAVDGPKGPYGVVKPGAIMAARASSALLVPMGSAIAGGGKVLDRAWDRYAIAWPFARVAVVLGAPLHATDATPELVAQAIAAANARAEALLARPETYMVASSRNRAV